jgi:hypothetical protein
MPDLFCPDWRSAVNLLGADACPMDEQSFTSRAGVHAYSESVKGVTQPFVCTGMRGDAPAHQIDASEAAPVSAWLAWTSRDAFDQPTLRSPVRLTCSACAEESLSLYKDEAQNVLSPQGDEADEMEAEAPAAKLLEEHHPHCPMRQPGRDGPFALARHAKSASQHSAVPATCWCTRHERMSRASE